jgi:hypothetical protein
VESCLCQVDSSFSLLKVIVAEKYSLHRLGQEPPPQQQEDSYDGRSLAEVSMFKRSPSNFSYSLFTLGLNDLRRNLLQIGYVSLLTIFSSIYNPVLLDSKTGGMGGKN